MRILCVRTGGFAGLTTRAEIDTAALTAQQNRELQSLIEQAGLLDQPAPKKRPSQAVADGFQYDLTINADDHEQKLRWAEGALSEEMLALLDWLLAHRPTKKH
jgi:hypothetical protein